MGYWAAGPGGGYMAMGVKPGWGGEGPALESTGMGAGGAAGG